MFEFFFKYPASVFSKGTFVLAGGWPVWLLILAIIGVRIGLAFFVRRSTSARVKGGRSAVVWLLQTLLASVLLLLVVAPGAERRDTASAAEYRGCGRGRFLQHGGRRCGERVAQERGGQRPEQRARQTVTGEIPGSAL